MPKQSNALIQLVNNVQLPSKCGTVSLETVGFYYLYICILRIYGAFFLYLSYFETFKIITFDPRQIKQITPSSILNFTHCTSIMSKLSYTPREDNKVGFSTMNV